MGVHRPAKRYVFQSERRHVHVLTWSPTYDIPTLKLQAVLRIRLYQERTLYGGIWLRRWFRNHNSLIRGHTQTSKGPYVSSEGGKTDFPG
jgi:hypothetical protein